MSKLLKSVLKTAVYLLERSDRVGGAVRNGVDRAGDRLSDFRDRAQGYGREDHTFRNVAALAAGIGIGIGAGILFAPASGEETRNSIGEKIQDIGDRVRERFSSEATKSATVTEGS